MAKKKSWILVALACLLAVGAAAVVMLRHSHREMDMLELLPPNSDLYGVADVQWMAQSPVLRKLLAGSPGVRHDQEYEKFIRASGFDYQTDLKRLVLGKFGQNWIGAALAHVDRPRVVEYLDAQGAEKTDVLGKTVYTVGHARPFRLAFLEDRGDDTLLAFSVGGDVSQIRQVAERHSGALHDSAASEWKRSGDHSHIPAGSRLWVVGQADRLWGANGDDAQVGSLGMSASLFKGSKTIYASLPNAATEMTLVVEDYCDSTGSAEHIAGTLRGLLALLKAVPSQRAGGDTKGSSSAKPAVPSPDDLLGGISVEQSQQSVNLKLRLNEQVVRFLEAN